MIYVTLNDGTRRLLDEAEVTFKWEGREYTLEDVRTLLFIEPLIEARPGNLSGMPVVGMKIEDMSDVRVETVVPVGFAHEFAASLNDVAEQSVVAAERVQEIIRRGNVSVAQSMADVASIFGAPPKPPDAA